MQKTTFLDSLRAYLTISRSLARCVSIKKLSNLSPQSASNRDIRRARRKTFRLYQTRRMTGCKQNRISFLARTSATIRARFFLKIFGGV